MFLLKRRLRMVVINHKDLLGHRLNQKLVYLNPLDEILPKECVIVHLQNAVARKTIFTRINNEVHVIKKLLSVLLLY